MKSSPNGSRTGKGRAVLSEFFVGVARLLDLHWLFVALNILIFTGTAAGVRKVLIDKHGFILAGSLWVSLFILLLSTRENGGMERIFLNQILVALCGVSAGIGIACYRRLVSEH